MHVARGPEIYRVTGVEAAIAANTTQAAVKFAWPRPVVVEGIFPAVSTDADADLSALEISIFDHRERAIVSDGSRALFVSAFALVGRRRRWHRLEIPVRAREHWIFQLRNVSGGGPITPRLYVRIRDES